MINSWLIKNYIRHFFTAKRNGHGVHSPFVFALTENVFSKKDGFYAFQELIKYRIELLKNHKVVGITDLGAGSKKLGNTERKISDIAKHGISSVKQSEFYFKLINYLNCKTIIELGTSIGLNTLYFSKANKKAEIYTIEGSESLYEFSKELFFEKKATNIHSIHGNFDHELPLLLSKLGQFDLLYIDGNHTFEATIRYFEEALKHKHANSIIVFDDIYWNKEMTQAWEKIKSHTEVKQSIDCFYFGLILFRDEAKQKEHFKIFL